MAKGGSSKKIQLAQDPAMIVSFFWTGARLSLQGNWTHDTSQLDKPTHECTNNLENQNPSPETRNSSKFSFDHLILLMLQKSTGKPQRQCVFHLNTKTNIIYYQPWSFITLNFALWGTDTCSICLFWSSPWPNVPRCYVKLVGNQPDNNKCLQGYDGCEVPQRF